MHKCYAVRSWKSKRKYWITIYRNGRWPAHHPQRVAMSYEMLCPALRGYIAMNRQAGLLRIAAHPSETPLPEEENPFRQCFSLIVSPDDPEKS
jgi:hypothetical protein